MALTTAASPLSSVLASGTAAPLLECTSTRAFKRQLRTCCQAPNDTTTIQSPPSPCVSRRLALTSSVAAGVALVLAPNAGAAPKQSLPPVDDSDLKLCDADCEKRIEEIPLQSTPSGLQFRDIVLGKGPSPPVGFQVAADYVAMVPSGRVFDSSLEKKVPYIFRVGTGQVVPGLDEGVLSMSVGGLRRLYIPGNLSFPKGLPAAPGRPRVTPNSPVVFDVKILYIPGLEDEDV